MSTGKTEHLELHRWEPGDDFLRSEFNENSDLLDAAIQAMEAAKQNISSAVKTEVLVHRGHYGFGSGSPTNLTFSFAPKVVIHMGYIRDSGEFSRGGDYHIAVLSALTTAWKETKNLPFFFNATDSFAKKSADGKTISFYSSNGYGGQNSYKYDYYYLAIG